MMISPETHANHWTSSAASYTTDDVTYSRTSVCTPMYRKQTPPERFIFGLFVLLLLQHPRISVLVGWSFDNTTDTQHRRRAEKETHIQHSSSGNASVCVSCCCCCSWTQPVLLFIVLLPACLWLYCHTPTTLPLTTVAVSGCGQVVSKHLVMLGPKCHAATLPLSCTHHKVSAPKPGSQKSKSNPRASILQ